MGALSGMAAEKDVVSYVNPLVGTHKSSIGYGGTMPFVTPPFGMTNWTPQTRQNKISVVSYNYDDSTISGFIGTHQPAIWMGDYSYVTVIPQVGELRTAPESRKLGFSHFAETAHPDYYRVSLDAGAKKQIQVEVTATERCGLFRFTFPKDAVARVIIEASRPGIAGSASVDLGSGEITGFIHAAGVSPSQASPETVLKVDLYGTALLLEEFGNVVASGGSGVVISSQSGHRLPALTVEQNRALATTPSAVLVTRSQWKPVTRSRRPVSSSPRTRSSDARQKSIASRNERPPSDAVTMMSDASTPAPLAYT